MQKKIIKKRIKTQIKKNKFVIKFINIFMF